MLNRVSGVVLVLMALLASPCFAATAIEDLALFAKGLERIVEEGAIRLEKVEQTTKTPTNAYKLTFSTTHPAMMAAHDGATSDRAYVSNQMKASAWQQKFCRASLRPVFREHRIDLISGALVSDTGEIQSLALCSERNLSGR